MSTCAANAPKKFKSDELPEAKRNRMPLLKVLHELGGKAEPRDVYPRLTTIFPQVTPEELTARTPSNPHIFRWHNLIQWSRQKLVEKVRSTARRAVCGS